MLVDVLINVRMAARYACLIVSMVVVNVVGWRAPYNGFPFYVYKI